ncbi:hypothetical protein MTO96_026143 [Rhipicephalus appendiculatus]
MVDAVKLKAQTVAALGSTSPLRSVGPDEDSSGGDSEHQRMMYQQQQQQLSRCEELCSLMGTVTLDTDSEHQWNSKQARNPQSLPRPTAGPPLSPIDMRDRERARFREKSLRNRILKVKWRRRHLDIISRLRKKVGALKKENTMLECAVNHLHDELHGLCDDSWWLTDMMQWLDT